MASSNTQPELEVVSLDGSKGLVVGDSGGLRQPITLWANASTHRLLVDIGNPTITASPASNGATGAAVPAQADYIGVNVGGNLVGLSYGQATKANSLPVTLASDQGAVTVQGVAANGAAVSGNPVLVGGFDGTNARDISVDTSGRVNQNLQQVAGAAIALGQTTMASSLPVAIASNQSAIPASQSGNWTARVVGNGGATVDAAVGAGTAPTNMIVGGAIYNSTEISPTTGQSFALQADSKGRLREVIMDAAGNTRGANVNASNQLSVSVDGFSATNASTNLNQVGGSSITLGSKTSANSLPVVIASDQGTVGVAEQATATGGYTPGHLVSAGSTNATSVKASAGKLGWVSVSNTNASPRYLKFFNKASAPTLGTDTPVLSILIPGNANGAGNNPAIPPQGLNFSTGIAFAIVANPADNDATAISANEVIVNYGYN